MKKTPLCFVTNNVHKFNEIQDILKSTPVDIIKLSDIGFTGEIPETGNTIEDNALQKARYIYERYQINCFADDTGLEVEALGGAPGVYSARYAGVGCTFDDNIKKLLNALQGKTQRKALFKTVIALIINGKEKVFTGIVSGNILNECRGSSGFGYDPVFVPEGYTQTYAEMSSKQKNAISHRALAIKQMINYLLTNNI